MAQTGFTPIQLYSSSTATNVPLAANLATGELAINITDGKLFYKDNAAAVQVIGWKTTPTSAGGTGLTSYTAGDTLYYASGTTLTKLAIGTAYQAFQVNAGATAPSWQPSSTSTLTAQGDLLYASAANTLARLAKNTSATRYLSNTGTTNNPAWAQIDLTNGVTGTLPVGNGGTGLTTLTAGYIPYGNATSAFSSSANLYYGGKNMGLGTSSPVDFGSGYTVLSVNDTTGGGVAFLAAATQKGSIFNAGNAMYIDCNNAAGVLNIRNTATGATSQFGATGIVTLGAYGVGTATFSATGVISSVSDETWKIKDGVPVNPDAMLQKLEPGYWFYNEEKAPTFGKDRQLGFYAQNVHAAIGKEAAPTPETFTAKDDNGNEITKTKPWGYYDRSVLAVVVMSLKNALSTIEELKQRIEVLEAK